MKKIDYEKTIEALEGEVWPPSSYDSRTVQRIHQLRRVKMSDLEPEDLRLLLTQSVGIPLIVERVVAILMEDPWIETDFYPGDLLLACLRRLDHDWGEATALKTILVDRCRVELARDTAAAGPSHQHRRAIEDALDHYTT
ncbi:MAG: contact-dependent growth inhibition system immunity protein [Bacteroidota bacterium]